MFLNLQGHLWSLEMMGCSISAFEGCNVYMRQMMAPCLYDNQAGSELDVRVVCVTPVLLY